MHIFVKYITGYGLLKQYNESGGSYPQFRDYSLLPHFILLMYLCKLLVFEKFGKIGYMLLCYNKSREFADKKENERKPELFAHEVYGLIFHSSLTFYCWYCFRSSYWFYNPFKLGFEFPGRIKYSFWLKLFYNIETANVIYSLTSLFYDRIKNGRKREFMEFFVHHTLTSILVFGSYMTQHGKLGLLVTIIHNLSEIPTYCCTICRDVEFFYGGAFFLFVMTVSWVVTRIIIFPRFLIGAVVMLISPNHRNNNEFLSFTKFFFFMLVGLFLMHIWWVYGMLRFIFLVVSGQYGERKKKELKKLLKKEE